MSSAFNAIASSTSIFSSLPLLRSDVDLLHTVLASLAAEYLLADDRANTPFPASCAVAVYCQDTQLCNGYSVTRQNSMSTALHILPLILSSIGDILPTVDV
jgi:hypothetical protein